MKLTTQPPSSAEVNEWTWGFTFCTHSWSAEGEIILHLTSVCVCVYVRMHIQGVSGGIVNILGGGSMEYS